MMDKAFDLILYSLVLLLFIAAGVLTVQMVLTSVDNIINILLLIGSGIGCSFYFIWLKAKSRNNNQKKQ